MMCPSHALDDVASTGAALLGWRNASATPVRGGGNNRNFRLDGSGGTAALKLSSTGCHSPASESEAGAGIASV